jgi:phosphoribosyl 1,2-cyclic phosphodiesterase
MIFLGSGSSTGCPVGECLFTLPSNDSSNLSSQGCQISHLASQGNPKFNKNYRNNPSFLIHHYHEGKYKNIIIDVGKTFREGAMRWFPEFHIQSLDAIVLTHEHMDASAGLDDVRSFQKCTPGTDGHPPSRKPVPLYLSQHCHDKLSSQFPFLLPKKKADDNTKSCCGSPPDSPPGPPGKIVVHRDVAGFQVNIFEALKPFVVEGLEVIPLPVWHGDDLISYGFAFSVKREDGTLVNVVYLSDISRMIDDTLDYIQARLPPTDILVVDALLWHRKHPTHYSLEQAVVLRDTINPRLGTFLVGMSCESYPPHEDMADYLNATYGNVTMAHDGLCLFL